MTCVHMNISFPSDASPFFKKFMRSAIRALCFLIFAGLASAQAADLGQEYEQVRKIALRDARVHDAFERANQRLDSRIVELDPALTAYVRAHPSGRGEAAPAAAPHA